MQVPIEHKLVDQRQALLIRSLAPLSGQRTTIIGVGQRLRADDGVGPEICSRIAGLVSGEVIDAGPVPENFIGPILRSRPQNILLIDAVDLGLAPGSVAVVGLERARADSISTHCCSIDMFIRILSSTIQVRTLLLGIQPDYIAIGQPISLEVQKAIELVSKTLIQIFGPARSISTPGPHEGPWRC